MQGMNLDKEEPSLEQMVLANENIDLLNKCSHTHVSELLCPGGRGLEHVSRYFLVAVSKVSCKLTLLADTYIPISFCVCG